MKPKLQFKAPAIALLLVLSVDAARAQFGMNPASGAPAPTVINPVTGLPTGPMIDPATGLPVAQAIPDWKDPNWKDPDIVLTNVVYDGLPLGEVAHNLRDQFKEQFDILLPGSADAGTTINPADGRPISGIWDIDWKSMSVRLQLRNVTASELFNAMNLLFENDRTPLRWELKVNGHRQVALLRVLVERTPQFAAISRESRKVYFVGDLLGDPKDGGMTIEQVIKTVNDVWKMLPSSLGGNIQFHKEAQLLVVTGTDDQVNFVEQTLSALQRKVALERESLQKSNAKPRAEESKTGGSAGSR